MKKIAVRILNFLLISTAVNYPVILSGLPIAPKIAAALLLGTYFFVFNIMPTFEKYPSLRLRALGDGAELILFFFMTCIVSVPFVVVSIAELVNGEDDYGKYIVQLFVLVIAEAIIFWNGIIRVYLTSVQLGIKLRVLGIVFGMILPVNLVMLMIIYITAHGECKFECEKIRLNESRKSDRICETKYPILLVHGVFFRDSRLLNYWGRVPAELEKNGAVVYYGEQQSALSVEDSSKELANRIKEIASKTGCGKLNIIAHSKGGLDSRYAISKLGCDKYVASLTTVNTPHKGCIFAEYLLKTSPEKLKKFIESAYNGTFRALGDRSPDFMSAVKNLTAGFCEEFNKEVIDSPEVMYQSIGSKAKNRRSGRFPLNVSYPVVKKYDGDNDGLVALEATEWGEKWIRLYPTGHRGITHADVIDLNRKNIKGFDVREFYVQLVADLKKRGL
ncbi:MAG: triacylglycerol lipase [Oscillospiraceae bacterium]|nr:triacylglycerol lipase [Oscillospiraceae bacterium]